jgi:alkanesulfonate monooxygenase SsuD/methylene tetrahydromethanopterin reductase-like flavin-dependent oxidoreductase (luciferase family)
VQVYAAVRTLDADRLSFGYLLPTRDAVTLDRPAGRPLIALGERAEALGFDAVWVGDGPLARARHDALTMLAALATRTERVVLATGVLLAALRPALLLAQAAATIDQLSEGRLLLGVGAGFPFPETERQFEAVGVPYGGRVTRMRETIEAMRMLWENPGERVSYTGAHVRLDAVALEPAPWREGGPPVWLAGAGEAAERRVGVIADGWLPYPPTPELYGEGWARVVAAAETASRPRLPTPGLYATVALDASPERASERLKVNIERYYSLPVELVGSIQAMYAGTPEGLGSWLAPYIDAGARHIVLRVSDEDAGRGLEAAGEAIEMLREQSTTAKEDR